MKRISLVLVLVGAVAVLMSGCATMDRFLPGELQESKKIMQQARMSEAAKQCPEKVDEMEAIWKDALDVYGSCRTKEAIARAKTINNMADPLCGPPPLKDTDGDGVTDDKDQCPNTPKGARVDKDGCRMDSDGDGVYDETDQCPDTPKGAKVDRVGCTIKVRQDTDADGLFDDEDKCPETPRGAPINADGCWVLGHVRFDTDKTEIKPQYLLILKEAWKIMAANPGLKMKIYGFTDRVASSSYNRKLSTKRAEAVKDYFVSRGISADRIFSSGFSFATPVGSNSTEEGRALNRRVELYPGWE